MYPRTHTRTVAGNGTGSHHVFAGNMNDGIVLDALDHAEVIHVL